LLPAATGFGLPVLVTLRSAWVAPATVAVAVAESSPEFVSCVEVAPVAVSVMTVPDAVPALTLTTTGNELDEPGATLGSLQLIVPPALPTVGRVQDHPEGTGVSDWNVVFVGTTSVKVAVLQLLGPLLLTVCV